AGAASRMIESKVGRILLKRNGRTETITRNVIETINSGDTVTNMNPGGGGYGNPYERPVEKVVADVRNGLVSFPAAKEDYGVVLKNAHSLEVDLDATKRLRGDTVSANP